MPDREASFTTTHLSGNQDEDTRRNNLRVVQNLMALPDQSLISIHEIRSHPIALAQCMTFLNRLHGVTLIESDDTAASARQISENRLEGVAAIGRQ